MNNSKIFFIEEVLSVVGDVRLVDEFSKIFDVVEHIIGKRPLTHELPKALDICIPELLRQYPDFKNIDFNVTEENYTKWLQDKIIKFGDMIVVKRMDIA